MKKSTKEVLVTIVIFFIVIIILISGAVLYREFRKNQQIGVNLSEEITIIEEDNSPPKIINEAPMSIIVGERYSYFPKIFDSDSLSEVLKVNSIQTPSWLKYEDGELYGVAEFIDVGNAKVVIIFQDEINVVSKEFYILVKE